VSGHDLGRFTEQTYVELQTLTRLEPLDSEGLYVHFKHRLTERDCSDINIIYISKFRVVTRFSAVPPAYLYTSTNSKLI